MQKYSKCYKLYNWLSVFKLKPIIEQNSRPCSLTKQTLNMRQELNNLINAFTNLKGEKLNYKVVATILGHVRSINGSITFYESQVT